MDVSSQMGPFSIVPEWVLDRGLSPTALKLYVVMARFADWQTGMAFPSRETLAERMGCSLKTVDRAVIEVVAAECVKKISRGRYASALYKVYQVDPRGTDLSAQQTDLSSEGTDLSKREDRNDHLTITTELEPLEQEPLNNLEKKVTNASKLSKLPPDWYPSERLLEMFATKWPNVDRDYEVEQFIDYWHAEGKTKANWDKAFQVWMNRAQQRSRSRFTQPRKLTNAEQGALLVQKYREEERQQQLEEARRLEIEGGANE